MNNPEFPFNTTSVFASINILNIMIAIFAYRLIKTDFLGGWKKSAGEYATGTSRVKTIAGNVAKKFFT